MKKDKGLFAIITQALGSYALCCMCLFALFILTLFGTLYQVENGLYDAKQTFFNSWFLWAELGGVKFPYFPAGVLSMSVLTINLIVGGLLRIRWSVKNTGVIIIHFGIVFMMAASLGKLTNSVEGHLTLWEGDNPRTQVDERASAHFVSYTLWEIAIWEVNKEVNSTELLVPDDSFSDLKGTASRKFTSPELPFDLTLKGFVTNARVMPKGPQWQAEGEVIDGFGILEMPDSKEAERDVAAIHAEVLVDGTPMKAILAGDQLSPWVIDVEGKRFAIDMRHTRYSMPYEIRLEDFIKEDHPGMTMVKSYRSNVTKTDEKGKEKVLIQMNEPLREGGLVLFQSSWGPSTPNYDGPLFSVFSVVRNPSDKWPEYAMWVITLGLLITFLRTLYRFTRKQLSEISKPTPVAS